MLEEINRELGKPLPHNVSVDDHESHWVTEAGWIRFLTEGVGVFAQTAIAFDSFCAHITSRAQHCPAVDLKMTAVIGPPNTTDLTQANDQLTNKCFRRCIVKMQMDCAAVLVQRAALDNAIAGHGRLVMLAGEPGIGKTRITQELVSFTEHMGAQVLWGWCYESWGAPP